MKIGMVSDSLSHLSRDKMLDTAARLGIKGMASLKSSTARSVPSA